MVYCVKDPTELNCKFFIFAAPVCINGELQTVGADNVAINYQNRVHVRYCYKGQWKSMCAGDTGNRLQTAIVICRQLGYSDRGQW